MSEVPQSISVFHRTAIGGALFAVLCVVVLGSSSYLSGISYTTPRDPSLGASASKPLVSTEGASSHRTSKSLFISRTSSSRSLQSLFKKIGYELEGVKKQGEVPRVFVGQVPSDLGKISEVAERKIAFIKFTLPLILHANESILDDRKRILKLRRHAQHGWPLSPSDRLWLATITKAYGLKKIDMEALIARVDIIPPSLAIAQAAEESGWGTSRFATEGNALFGQRIYRTHQKGIIPFDRPKGKNFRVRSFDQLLDGVKAYVHNLNSHFAYESFREQRAMLRATKSRIDGYTLAGTLMRYSERGGDYIHSIRLIIRANSLIYFDTSRLGDLERIKTRRPGA